jgi:hypothetical protein
MGVDMTRFIPAWHRRKMAEEAARRKAPPVAAHILGAIINALGELQQHQKQPYLDMMVQQGKLTPEQSAYVARVAGL